MSLGLDLNVLPNWDISTILDRVLKRDRVDATRVCRNSFRAGLFPLDDETPPFSNSARILPSRPEIRTSFCNRHGAPQHVVPNAVAIEVFDNTKEERPRSNRHSPTKTVKATVLPLPADLDLRRA